MSDPSPPTLGAKIDALLAPFVEDETSLQKRLADLEAEAQRINEELGQVNEDLAVVQSAKVDALRQAVEADPLLSAVFTANPSTPKLVADGEADEPEIEVVEESSDGDGHPLLSHAS